MVETDIPAVPAKSARLAAYACYFLGSLQLWLQPSVVADFIGRQRLSDADAGLLATVEMVVVSATMLVAPRFSLAVSLRALAVAGSILAALGSIASIPLSNWFVLAGVRTFAAVGFGLLLLCANVAIGRMRDAQATFGKMYMVSLLGASVTLAVLPLVQTRLPYAAAFVLVPVAAGCLGILTLRTGTGNAGAGGPDRPRTVGKAIGAHILALAMALSLLAVGFFGFWAFLVRYAEKSGVDASGASFVSSLSILAAMAGSMLSAALTKALGFRFSATLAASAIGLSVMALMTGVSPIAFYVACCLALGCFYLLFPLVLGAAAELDATGVGPAYVSAIALLMGAFGPYLFSVIASSAGIGGAMTAVALCTAGSIGLFQVVASKLA
ncbi:MFS transporter [Novosphingobium sp. MW5]|nr:MFS transporter [Novosphingobium sp. MW5]